MEQLALEQLVVTLVEPSPMQRNIVTGFLQRLGVRTVLTAESGAEALRQIREEGSDLVVSALYLPDMTGTDLVHALREDPDLAGKAFMLISSETRIRYLEPVRQAGVIAILPKPFGLEELRIGLKNTLDFLSPDGLALEAQDAEDLSVLIVDDSGLARRYVRKVLADMGIERFTEARDGVEALRLLGERYFDVVVTDYNMPNMDGRELVEHIRADGVQASVPVLMVTSEEREGRLAAVLQAGVSAICDKPFEPATLRRLLHDLLSGAGTQPAA